MKWGLIIGGFTDLSILVSNPSSRRLSAPDLVSTSVFSSAPVYTPTAVMAAVVPVKITVLRLRSEVVMASVVPKMRFGCGVVVAICAKGSVGLCVALGQINRSGDMDRHDCCAPESFDGTSHDPGKRAQ